MEWLVALAALTGLALDCVIQICWFRLNPGGGLLRSMAAGFAGGAACTAAASISDPAGLTSCPAQRLAGMAANLLAYTALAYGYLAFVNMGETARRIRLLRELETAGGALTRQELLRRYNAQEIVRRRLDRLLATGQVVFRDGRYFIHKSMVLRMARLLEAMKLVLVRKRGEFD